MATITWLTNVDEALAKAGEHRERPFQAVSDQREDDVAAAHAEPIECSGEPGRGAGERAERVLEAPAVARQLDHRARLRRRILHDVTPEVHVARVRPRG